MILLSKWYWILNNYRELEEGGLRWQGGMVPLREMQKTDAAKRAFALIVVACLLMMGLPAMALAVERDGQLAETEWTDVGTVSAQGDEFTYDASLVFSNTGITELLSGSGYSINGTTLTISAAGTYLISGSCSEGNIEVAKGLSDVTLLLDGLELASSTTAPLVVKKSSAVDIHLMAGTTTVLTDDEDPANETSADTAVADAFEGACIKAKSGSTVTICGEGSLNCVANAKNGIKGGATSALVFNQSGTVRVSGSYSGVATSGGAVNNGIAADGSIVFNQGEFDIDAANDGIKSAPDATDEAAGTTLDSESAGTVTINGGTFDVDVDGDGIQADTELVINNGTFDITTLGGYNTQGTKYNTNGRTGNYTFNADTMSCKGLKAAGDRAQEVGTEPQLKILGGTFILNCADDAVHSDGYATVTGGTFDISSGDDGMHADTSLTLGAEGSSVARDPEVVISYSYEGLEGGTVYLYQGRYMVAAKDDGMNAAGGNDGSGQEPGGGFNPGGQPGGPGGWGGWGGPGGSGGASGGSSDYNIYVYGGKLYVNCDGDGLDSNGGLYLYGGMQTVFSMAAGGDNSALDHDGTLVIDGATVFTAGETGVDGSVSSTGSSQRFKAVTTTFSAGSNVCVTENESIVYSDILPKRSRYTFYSSPTLGSSADIVQSNGLHACSSNSWAHSWDGGATSDGVTTYTCSSCGVTETQTVAETIAVAACGHAAVQGGSTVVDEGYEVAFSVGEGASVNVYYTQDYTAADEVGASSAVSRNSDTGDPDSTGDGQVNFSVVLDEGYQLASTNPIVIEGTYKNLKDVSTDDHPGMHRITKIGSALTVSIATEKVSGGDQGGDESGSGEGGSGEGGGGDEGGSGTGDGEGGGSGDEGGSGSGSGSSGDASSSGSTSGNSPAASSNELSESSAAVAATVAAGVSAESVDAFLTSRASDADPAGSVFGKLRLKVAKVTKSTVKLSWAKVPGATQYIVYGSKCGKGNKLVKLATVTGKAWTGKKLKKGTYYKYLVVAVSSDATVVSASKMVHAATKGGKVTNPKKVKLTNAKTGKTAKKISLAKGKALKLKAGVTKVDSKLSLKTHRKVKWESSNAKVATVSSSGKVKAVGAGTCYIYAYAQNGVFAKCKVTVK